MKKYLSTLITFLMIFMPVIGYSGTTIANLPDSSGSLTGSYYAPVDNGTVTQRATLNAILTLPKPGTATNDNAPAGDVGEYIMSATGSSISLSTGTTANVTSISLTSGDWDVTGAVDYTFGATTSVTDLIGGVSTTSATLGAQDTFTNHPLAASVPTAAFDAAYPLPVVRISLASTTTVYLVAQGTFTISTLKAYGTIRARRMR